ncbi:MAG: LptF/LptG family permease [Bacteroidota bacterium]
MKRLDLLILKSFIGPFILTTFVATFILLTQYMLKYFDDFVGKDLEPSVFAELILYFSINIMPDAIPLAILLSSLMTFGKLGEHFELTAIKSAGISLIRVLMPIGIFVSLVAVGVFFFINNVVPAANLKAYTLLYDIKNQKPALDIRAGQFYNGIEGYSIKAKEKYPDNRTLKDVIIYDHTAEKSNYRNTGNLTVIVADSAIMHTVYNDRYLKLELYKGNYYKEQRKGKVSQDLNSQYVRSNFDQMEMMFSLASFDFRESDVGIFQNNGKMKNMEELSSGIDSLNLLMEQRYQQLKLNILSKHPYHLSTERKEIQEAIRKPKSKDIRNIQRK